MVRVLYDFQVTSIFNYHGIACYSLFSVLGRIYSLTVLSTLILPKVMHRSDPSTARIDGDSSASGDPVALTTICESVVVRFSGVVNGIYACRF